MCIQSSTIADLEHHLSKWHKHKETHHTREPRCQLSPGRWSQGCKEETNQNNKNKHETKITKKDPQKKNCLQTVSKKLLEGLNMFKCTNLILSYNVDHGT